MSQSSSQCQISHTLYANSDQLMASDVLNTITNGSQQHVNDKNETQT